MRSPQMKKKRIGVVGAGGRMGTEIAKALAGHPSLEAYLGVDRSKDARGFTHSAKDLKSKAAASVDLWIDFSSPETLEQVLTIAEKTKTPVVSGTTGLSAAQEKRLARAKTAIPVLWASNMSLGVAVLREVLANLAPLRDFDFQIEEVHHSKKKDRPSGTAKTLQADLEKAVGRKLPEPLAIRGGGVFGIHKVWAMSDEEVLTFEHHALNRAVFARGAVRAADWLLRQKRPGLYSMRDVLLS